MQTLEQLCKVSVIGGEVVRPKVAYLPSEHQTYKVDGNKVCGASTIAGRDPDGKEILVKWATKLSMQGICPEAFKRHTANIGTMAHKMIELDLCGTLFSDYMDNQYGQHNNYNLYIHYATIAYKKFVGWMADHPLFKIIFTEKILTSKIYGYGGQIDIYGELGDKKVLVDIKTGSGIYMAHLIQVGGGYENLLTENEHYVDETYILNVSRDEGVPYKFKRVEGTEYLSGIFCDLLYGYQGHQKYSTHLKSDVCKEEQALHDAWLENLRSE